MTFWKTKVEKLSLVLVLIFILTIVLVIFKYFISSLISTIGIAVLLFFWYRSGSEEAVISILKDNFGSYKYDKFIQSYPRNMVNAISRLKKKSVIKIDDGIIILLDKDRLCAFDRFKKRKDS